MRNIVAVWSIGMGVSVSVWTSLHHVIVNPELTQAQALVHYLPFWIVCCLFLGAGVCLYSEKK